MTPLHDYEGIGNTIVLFNTLEQSSLPAASPFKCNGLQPMNSVDIPCRKLFTASFKILIDSLIVKL